MRGSAARATMPRSAALWDHARVIDATNIAPLLGEEFPVCLAREIDEERGWPPGSGRP